MPAILGTAGHIDHGKTALIKALTGIDTDRLKEERERGISIDLGFAHFDLGDGRAAGVVDVPGHERFIRNMLAGAHGIDLVLLVVAADDGVMPQTEEHLDILHLLGARRGVVALTKVDLVDPGRRAAVREEIAILLAGTALEEAPIHEVSCVTGEGIVGLKDALRGELARYERGPSAGCFRLPVDRSFILHGHGVVVTGTATAGEIANGATVRILPGGRECRVRTVQVHGRSVARARAGERVALNLAGVERDEVERGHVICDQELERVSDRIDVWTELRPAARRPVPNHSLVRLHVGTVEAMAKIVWLDGRKELAPREQAYAQLVVRRPIAVFGGDRFILREQTARATIGGGVVLHPFARRPARRPDPRLPLLAELHAAREPAARLDAILRLEIAFAVSPESLAAAANLRAAEVRGELAKHPNVRALPDAAHAEAYTTAEKWERLRASAAEALALFHRELPKHPGMEMESLRSSLAPDLSPKVFRAVIAELEREGTLERRESIVHLPSHRVGLDEGERQLAEAAERLLLESGLTPPDLRTIESRLAASRTGLQAILTQLEREGRIVRVAPDLLFAAPAVERARELIRDHAAHHGDINAAKFRDLIGASRKFSIALLNYFDRTGFTIRIGDVRKVRR